MSWSSSVHYNNCHPCCHTRCSEIKRFLTVVLSSFVSEQGLPSAIIHVHDILPLSGQQNVDIFTTLACLGKTILLLSQRRMFFVMHAVSFVLVGISSWCVESERHFTMAAMTSLCFRNLTGSTLCFRNVVNYMIFDWEVCSSRR